MAYESAKYNYPSSLAAAMSFGTKSRVVAPSDATDLDPYANAIVVTSGGNLVILPMRNADGVTVTFTNVPVGFIPPYKVRRVLATGTTASVATVDEQ